MGPVALREAPCSYFLFPSASLFHILFRWIENVLESAGISSDVLLDHWRLHFVTLHFLDFYTDSGYLHHLTFLIPFSFWLSSLFVFIPARAFWQSFRAWSF